MDASVVSPKMGWASGHPKTVGWLILLTLHLVFAVSPYALAQLAFSSHPPALSGSMWLGEWTGFKREASLLLLGIVQLFYVIPAILLTLKLHHPMVAKGILHGALVTFFLNLSACGFFAWQLSKIEG